MIKRLKSRLHHLGHAGEPYIHTLYCGVLFFEGHGLYAMVGGVLGIFVLFNTVFGD